MLSTAMDSALLMTKDSVEVKKILGEPSFWLDQDSNHTYSWRYYAGTKMIQGNKEKHFLDISFDTSGKIEKLSRWSTMQ
jgi:hypothetical protein